jgi:hypothetical protein
MTSTRFGARVAQHLLRALVDGLRLGKNLRNRGLFIDVYKAPLIKIPPNQSCGNGQKGQKSPLMASLSTIALYFREYAKNSHLLKARHRPSP